MTTSRKAFCTFYVGDLFLGVDLLQVQEVTQRFELTHVPLAVGMVRGLMNLRGQIVTALDLRYRFGLPPLTEDIKPMCIVLRRAPEVVSFLVDGVGDAVEAGRHEFEPPPQALDETVRGFIQAVCKQPGRLLLILDPERLFDTGSVVS